MKAWKKGAVIGVVLLSGLFLLKLSYSGSPSCLEKGYSTNLCERILEEIDECSQTESLKVCEDRYYTFADDMARVEADIERSKKYYQNVSPGDMEVILIPEHNTKLPPEVEEIVSRIHAVGGGMP